MAQQKKEFMDNNVAKFPIKVTAFNNLHEAAKQHMTQNGYDFQGMINVNGKINRFSVDDKRNKPDEWYVAFEGISFKGVSYLVVTYGSWSKGDKYEFKSWEEYQVDYADLQDFRDKWKTKKEETEKELIKARNDAAQVAQNIWHSSLLTPPTPEHARYITTKGIQALGIRYGLNTKNHPCIIVPIENIDGSIRTIQFISCDSQGKSFKTFLPEGEKKGNFHIITQEETVSDNSHIYITEGWATGISVYEALHRNNVVIVALDAGNIFPVVENIRSKFPHVRITIAADNDERGQLEANKTAKIFGCSVVAPKFPPGCTFTDFNDLHHSQGLSFVSSQIKSNLVSSQTMQDELRNIAHNFLKKEDPCIGFDRSLLPEAIGDYISSICETTNAHPIMITCSVLAMISGYLGARVYIPKGHYFQKLYPNLWFICISDSGHFKTTALNNGARIAYRNKETILEEIRTLKENMGHGNDDDTKKEILKLSNQDIILPNRSTGEAFIEHMSQGHNGTIYTSELGAWLKNLDKSHNSDFMGILTDLYDVPQTWQHKTKTQGDYILRNPCFSICGVSTLAWLKESFKEKDLKGGFFARFLIFVPPHSDELPDGLPKPVDDQVVKAEEIFNQRLQQVINSIGAQKEYILSPLARSMFDNKNNNRGFHQQIYTISKTYGTDVLGPFTRRWSPSILKLAMIMQLFIDPETNEISSHAVCAAFSILVPAIKSTAHLLQGELMESEPERELRDLKEWIYKRVEDRGRPVNYREIATSKKIKSGKTKDLDSALEMLVSRGDVEHQKGKDKSFGTYNIPSEDL